MQVSGIQPLSSAAKVQHVQRTPSTETAKRVDGAPSGREGRQPAEFGNLVSGFVNDVDSLQKQAAQSVTDLATGESANLHQVVLALGKAEISFKYMMEVRNKLLEAYKEVMRMPV